LTRIFALGVNGCGVSVFAVVVEISCIEAVGTPAGNDLYRRFLGKGEGELDLVAGCGCRDLIGNVGLSANDKLTVGGLDRTGSADMNIISLARLKGIYTVSAGIGIDSHAAVGNGNDNSAVTGLYCILIRRNVAAEPGPRHRAKRDQAHQYAENRYHQAVRESLFCQIVLPFVGLYFIRVNQNYVPLSFFIKRYFVIRQTKDTEPKIRPSHITAKQLYALCLPPNPEGLGAF